MKAYPAYKETGIIWLGKIPTSWQVKRIKQNTYVKGRIGWQGLNTNEYGTVGPYLVTGTDFSAGRINWDTCHHISEERYAEDPYIQLQEKDLLITKDGTIGKIALVDNLPDKATLNSGVFVTRPQNNDYITPFMYWVLNSDVFNTFIDYIKMGSTIQHLYQRTFVEFSYPVPSIPEQQAIADFLACKTAQIDALVEKKQREIELLQEQHTALINHAVTKGLNPNVKMKDSGVEWFEEIPISWNTPKLSFVADVSNGSTPSKSNPDYWENGSIPWLSSSKVNDYVVREPSELITEKALKECSVSLYPKGTVILGMIGQGKTRGMSAYLDIEACINQNIAGIIPHKNLNSRFLHLFFITFYERIRELGRGANQPALNCDLVSSIRILFPPIEEQNNIVEYLDKLEENVVRTTSKITKEMELLQEYRTALISEAVTGKIDVREQVDKQGYRGAVLIIGSLWWDNSDRERWRNERLKVTEQVIVSVPIRYGRVSGGRRKNTYTMVFSNLCYQEGMGTALLVPFQKEIFTLEDLKAEAAKLWHAERPASNDASHEICCDWGAVGLMVNPDAKFSHEIIAGWKSYYQEQNEKPKIHYAPNEAPIISDDGILNFEFPKRIDDSGQPAEFDFILATAIKPHPNTGIYPTAQQIAETYNRNNYTEYFENNRKQGITTFQDEEIGRLLNTKK